MIATRIHRDHVFDRSINVWVQRFKGRTNLMLQWFDPVSGQRRSRTSGTSDPVAAEMERAKLESTLNQFTLSVPDLPETPFNKWTDSDWRRFNTYDLSPAEYQALLQSQSNGCAICSSTDPRSKNGLFVVDHCHKTGKVRGLLCNSCNVGIGLLGDTADGLRRAARYLEARS